MTPEQRGGYINLLAHEWLEEDCSLPDDDAELAFLSGLNDRWPECSSLIRKCFEKRGKKLFNLRLLEEREKQEAFRQQCSKAGRKSGEVRRNKELEPKVGSTDVEQPLNSSSSVFSLLSSTASSLKDKDIVLSFNEIWSKYPMKAGKKEALRHYKATVKTQEDADNCEKALVNYLDHLTLPQNSYKHPMNGSTWFNNWQDFLDWIEPPTKEEQASQQEQKAESIKALERDIDSARSDLKDAQWYEPDHSEYQEKQKLIPRIESYIQRKVDELERLREN